MDRDLKGMALAGDFWRRGSKDNFSVDGAGNMKPENRLKRGAFFSGAVDLLENGMTYHRLTVEGIFPPEANIQVGLRASDLDYIIYRDLPVPVDAFLADRGIAPEEKLELFGGRMGLCSGESLDIFPDRLKGRYLWIYLSAFDMSGEAFVFKSIRVDFPQVSFIEYLPEVYQKESGFLKRYLGVFQSIFLDMERSIDRFPLLLDADTAEGKAFDYLASWLGMHNEGSILDGGQFRFAVKNAVALNKAKGTVKSITDMVRLYTGEEPYIVEYFKLKGYTRDNAERETLYDRIYTDNPHTFCIILKDGSIFDRPGRLEELSRLLEKVRPAHTIARMIILRQNIRLDIHSYIGVNARLEKPGPAVIDDNTRLDAGFYLNV